MNGEQQSPDLERLLEKICETGNHNEKVSVNAVLDAVGHRSFGPILIVAGLITLAPVVGDIPGVPTIIGILVFLIAIQLLLQRKHFWLPKWILKRSVEREKMKKVVKWLHPSARFFDRILHSRLTVFADGPAVYFIAVVCLVIAACMPIMEIVPFSANIAGVALAAFGFALISRDGLLALFAFLVTAGGLVLMSFKLF
ncbi:MAG: exopolysaccharide biosynthesis protein [Desulfobulbaceae bacterium]|nr:exopolysaccharide biosynthesis protein [Desulfobulbaceae bacterium]